MITAIFICPSCQQTFERSAVTEQEIKNLQKIVNTAILCPSCQQKTWDWCCE